ncbi:hypothetical protein AB0J80_08615 [Actinoplanes sp. NPDC049548]|uniref:hypothetical protein n=1 Tax=Actinoplanes sp. NPDC049548 TaxID=3155152 RepID=UPI00342ECEDC
MIDSSRSAPRWLAVVVVLWLLFAAERFFAYRFVGYGPTVLVLHGVGWLTATVVTVTCIVIFWRRSKRSVAAAAAALGLLSAGVISVVDWRPLHAREFYRENRQDFAKLVDQVRQGLYNADTAGGSRLPDELAHLSKSGWVAAMDLPKELKSVLFLPVTAARGDSHGNGAGVVHGCAIGYLNLDVEIARQVEKYDVCPNRTPLGDGWYWAD